MSDWLPQERVFWDALLFRLSGDENQLVRRLIAGNPSLTPEAFNALLLDSDLDVLTTLSENPSLPEEAALQLLRHPDAADFLSEDWYDWIATQPWVTTDDLDLIIENGGDLAQRWAVENARATWNTVRSFLCRYEGFPDDPIIAGLLQRFPPEQYLKDWCAANDDKQLSGGLLDCPLTPPMLLMEIAKEQYRLMERQGGWDYLHEMTERLFQHPLVESGAFGLLMNHWVFQEKDYDHDLRCLHIISGHPRAEPEQRQGARRLIETADEWGPRELDD